MRYPGYNYSYRMRGEFKVMKMKIRTVNFYHAQLMLFQLASCGNTLRLHDPSPRGWPVRQVEIIIYHANHSADLMKYDDWSRHPGGNFPADLPPEAGATHAGMFLAWALLAGLGSADTAAIDNLRNQRLTPGRFFLAVCDGKLTDSDLSVEGNAFAQVYFEDGDFLADYEGSAGQGLPSLYHVADSWETYAKLQPLFDRRLSEWKAARS